MPEQQTSYKNRERRHVAGIAVVAGLTAGAIVGGSVLVVEAVQEALDFANENSKYRTELGAGLAIGGIIALSQESLSRRRSLAVLSTAGSIAGCILLAPDAFGGGHQDESTATTTTIEQPSEVSDAPAIVDNADSQIVITIPRIEGLPCEDTLPYEATADPPGNTTYGIIQKQQKYSPDQMNTLFDAAPAIANLRNIRAGETVIDINCLP